MLALRLGLSGVRVYLDCLIVFDAIVSQRSRVIGQVCDGLLVVHSVQEEERLVLYGYASDELEFSLHIRHI